VIPPAALVALSIINAGCGPTTGLGDPDAGATPFIAVQGDFACYRAWTAFDGGMGAADGLGVPNEPRTIYINQLPPPGSRTFPIGTIIVKDTATAQTFAMVKRGGGFNPAVDDWEWFELTTASTTPPTSCAPLINWRGTAPPAGTVYGMITTTCPNDYVAGSSLQLSHF
jgi:hypothetical protein